MREIFRIDTERVAIRWSAIRDAPPAVLAGTTPPPGLLEVVRRRATAALAVRHDESPRLFEQTDYRIVVESESGRVRVEHDDPLVTRELESLRNGRSLFGHVNFRSQVGRTRFRVLVDDQPELDFETEVFPTKLDYHTDYFELLADTQDIITSLAIEYLRATYNLGTPAISPNRPSHLEWLTILRHVFDTLERALRRIAQRPVRSIDRTPRATKIERVRRVDSALRRSMARDSGSRRFVQTQTSELTLDTAEHRWLRARLARIRATLASLVAHEQRRTDARAVAIVGELRSLEVRVVRLLNLEPMRGATGEPPSGFASLQLLKTDGYREAYLACAMLGRTLKIDADVLRLSVKDVSLVYEYWCVLATLRAVARCTGSKIEPRDLLRVDQTGIHVHLHRGKTTRAVFDAGSTRTLEVTYGPRFHGPQYLIAQEPDLVLSINEAGWPRAQIILDAKYRVDADPQYVAKHGSPGPPADAINALHRYRDAIFLGGETKRSVIQAAALFPYRERGEREFETSGFWRMLQRIGIGAIPLLPHGERYLNEWLSQLLRRGGWSIADLAIPHASHERAWSWQAAASELVLVGTLRTGDEARHLDWIRSARLYYIPETRQRRQFATKWIALYDRGAVRWCAAVEGIETAMRREIVTPWPSKRDPDERQVLYRLGELRSGLDVANVRGERFSQHRWSSRLALLRARTLVELALETEPEWRLYEDLRASGRRFEIEPRAPRLQSEAVVGRAVFIVGDLRIRHRGADRFEISAAGREPREVALRDVSTLLR